MNSQEKKQKKLSEIYSILESDNVSDVRALFAFNNKTDIEEILKKFRIWSRWFFPDYFLDQNEDPIQDAPFHKDFDVNTLKVYLNQQSDFLNAGFRGSSKRQPLDAKILTPKGFVRMGDLNIGSIVIGSDGKPTEVEYISPTINRPIYRLMTEDGRTTECDSEHLWTVRKMTNVKEKRVTISTQKMLDDGLFYERRDNK